MADGSIENIKVSIKKLENRLSIWNDNNLDLRQDVKWLGRNLSTLLPAMSKRREQVTDVNGTISRQIVYYGVGLLPK